MSLPCKELPSLTTTYSINHNLAVVIYHKYPNLVYVFTYQCYVKHCFNKVTVSTVIVICVYTKSSKEPGTVYFNGLKSTSADVYWCTINPIQYPRRHRILFTTSPSVCKGATFTYNYIRTIKASLNLFQTSHGANRLDHMTPNSYYI